MPQDMKATACCNWHEIDQFHYVGIAVPLGPNEAKKKLFLKVQAREKNAWRHLEAGGATFHVKGATFASVATLNATWSAQAPHTIEPQFNPSILPACALFTHRNTCDTCYDEKKINCDLAKPSCGTCIIDNIYCIWNCALRVTGDTPSPPKLPPKKRRRPPGSACDPCYKHNYRYDLVRPTCGQCDFSSRQCIYRKNQSRPQDPGHPDAGPPDSGAYSGGGNTYDQGSGSGQGQSGSTSSQQQSSSKGKEPDYSGQFQEQYRTAASGRQGNKTKTAKADSSSKTKNSLLSKLTSSISPASVETVSNPKVVIAPSSPLRPKHPNAINIGATPRGGTHGTSAPTNSMTLPVRFKIQSPTTQNSHTKHVPATSKESSQKAKKPTEAKTAKKPAELKTAKADGKRKATIKLPKAPSSTKSGGLESKVLRK
ncbi:hypothetical protein EK21DRAFT_85171 [Setomelanomma holmii]|uniref:Zn(2)-C6 fungal-type domain-containing protein n=1 Tax=Setomelanomma holmii TaxID=210430 RepID=A0A9P4LQT3_9PLEO|nr:hypothetical protein EK21DRAFT_85171 [Setomelanomma holmii]